MRSKEESVSWFLGELEKTPQTKVHGRNRYNAHLVDELVNRGKCVMVDSVLYIRV
jgi:hypothetical protein